MNGRIVFGVMLPVHFRTIPFRSGNMPNDIVIHKIDCSLLVELVESGKFLTDDEYCKNIIKEVLEDVFLDNLVDVATLSSTHLPFLEPFLRSIFKNVKFLDPAKNISNILKDFAEDNDLQQNILRIFTSGDVKLFKKNLQMMEIGRASCRERV